jgi:nitroreductase
VQENLGGKEVQISYDLLTLFFIFATKQYEMTMETLNALLDRRSIRKFLPVQVEAEKLDKILEAAMFAPTARDTQSWQFLVVTHRETLDRIMDVHPYAKMLKYATAAILVCGDMEREENVGYQSTNCAAATQNILLAAYAQGLGSVWLGVYPRDERMDGIKKALDLPSHILPFSLIALGYPDEQKARPQRYDKAKVHYEKW